MPQHMEIAWNGASYMVEIDGEELVVSEAATNSETAHVEERVPLAELSEDARTELLAGTIDSPSVRVALGGVLSALSVRGG